MGTEEQRPEERAIVTAPDEFSLDKNVHAYEQDFEQLNKYEKLILGFSGGKNSLGALIWLLEHGGDRGDYPAIQNLREKLVVYHVNVRDIEFPDTLDYLKYIEAKTGIEIVRLESSTNFDEHIAELGYPFMDHLWCHMKLKMQVIYDWWDQNSWTFYSKKPSPTCHLIGVRGWESNFRTERGRFIEKEFRGSDVYYPVFTWREKYLLEYIQKQGYSLPPCYELANRNGCWACPNQTAEKVLKLKKYRPELYRQLLPFFRTTKNCETYRVVQKDAYAENLKKFILEPGKANLQPVTKYIPYLQYVDRYEIAKTIRDNDPDYKFLWSGYEEALNAGRQEKEGQEGQGVSTGGLADQAAPGATT